MARAVLTAVAVLAVLVLAGCSGATAEESRRPLPHTVYTAAAPLPDESTLTAREIATELSRLHPLPNPRDNSGPACACLQLITTDAVSVYQMRTEEDAAQFAAGREGPDYPDDGYRADRAGVFVLNYSGSSGSSQMQTSDEARDAFRDRLIELVAERG